MEVAMPALRHGTLPLWVALGAANLLGLDACREPAATECGAEGTHSFLDAAGACHCEEGYDWANAESGDYTCAPVAGPIGPTECVPDCDSRECGPDPACGVDCGACTSPPRAECVTDYRLRRYAATGTCDDGECAYDFTYATCTYGCDAAAGECIGCSDGCPQNGASECSAGYLRRCTAGSDGCLSWSAPTRCSDGFCADATSCGSCADECSAVGLDVCSDGVLTTCVADANGCLSWSAGTNCPSGFCANGQSCGVCNNECSPAGATSCSWGELYTCIEDTNGCTSWSAPVTCSEGFCRDATACGSCNDTCSTSGARECVSGSVRTCTSDANGCLAWSTWSACSDGFCANATTCGTCYHQCTTVGATECFSGQLRTCVADANGCRSWSSYVPCTSGFCANATTCGTCTPTTCAAEGKNCGTIADGCGGTLACGSCDEFSECGGGGVANVCGGRREPMTPICSVDNWCWENPLPQGHDLLGAFATPGGEQWVVGKGGTVLRWNGSTWSGWLAVTGEWLRGVWASSSSNVWAVGNAGTILRYTGSSWSTVTSPTTSELRGIWGAASNSIWAVGASGTVLKYNGTSWSLVTVPTTAHLSAVWGTSASDVWAVGAKVILHWNGSAWSATTAAWDLASVWGTSTTDVWVASYSGVMRWNGTSWNSSTSAHGYAVRGSSATDVWVVSSQLGAYHFDGLTWSSTTIGGGHWYATLNALTGNAADNLLAVGDNGVIYRRTADGWHLVSRGVHALLPERIQLSTLAATSAGVVFAAGFEYGGGLSDDYGYVMQRTADGWMTSFTSRPPENVVDLSGSSATDAWAVSGYYDRILHWTGSYWSTATTPWHLWGIGAAAATDVWAVGGDRTAHFDGTAWSLVPNPVSGTSVTLGEVTVRTSSDVWVGGSNGTLLRWNGTAFATVPTGVTATIGKLSAPASNFALACAGNDLLRWDGTSWASAGIAAWAVWAGSATNAWALVPGASSYSATPTRWDGTSWTPARVGVLGDMSAQDLAGSGAQVWVLGEQGEILHHP
jgi:hypothetical protein